MFSIKVPWKHEKSEANIFTGDLLGFPFVIKSVVSTSITTGSLVQVCGPCELSQKLRLGPLEWISAEKFSSCPYELKSAVLLPYQKLRPLLSIDSLMKNPHNINGISPAEAWNFDIDAYISPFIPSPRVLRRLPTCISRFLGHRNEAREGELDIVVWTWTFVGAFTGVAVVETVFIHWSYFSEKGCPMIVGSYGAAAILLYGAVDSPLAQPRNAFFGQLLSATTGVAITKLFLLSDNFDSLVWLVGALACASASLIMTITKTVHPPAGATALLAAVDPGARGIGWGLIPVVIISSALMISVACILDNLQRSYPRYWWTPGSVGKEARRKDCKVDSMDVEKGKADTTEGMEVVVGAGGIVLPEFLVLGEVEKEVLMQIRGRIANFNDGRDSESSSL